jgi:hypothetical protein
MLRPANRTGRFESKERTMYSIPKIKAAAATLMVGFLLASAFVATAEAGNSRPHGLTVKQFMAVQARAKAMDRYYQIGAYSPAALVQKAEKAKAQAEDQYYGLGTSYVVESTSPFQWSDAGIGAGAMLGAILVAGGLAIVLRRRGRSAVPRTT